MDLGSIIADSVKDIKKSTVEILESSKTLDWDSVKGKTRTEKALEKNLSDWTSYNFIQYVKNCYYKKYNLPIGVGPIKAIQDMKIVIERLRTTSTRFESNIQIKEYIDWYFISEIDTIINRFNAFHVKMLANSNNINRYIDLFPIIENKKEITINKEDLYLVSKLDFIKQFGIIESYKYMLGKFLEEGKSIEIISSIIKNNKEKFKDSLLEERKNVSKDDLFVFNKILENSNFWR